MIVVATDAPLDARDLKRLAARAVFGLARTGSSFSHGSGDYAIAFSTAPGLRTRVGDATPAAADDPAVRRRVSPLFQAALEATEEAVYNSLFRATTMTGNGRTVEAIPLDRVRETAGERRAALVLRSGGSGIERLAVERLRALARCTRRTSTGTSTRRRTRPSRSGRRT